MKALARLLSPMALASALVACTNMPPAEATAACSAESIAQSDQPAALRSLAKACASGEQADLLVVAIAKLNELTPVAGQPIGLQPAATRSQSEQVTFELELRFDPLEAYPPDADLHKLDVFIQGLNMTYAIDSVRLVGRAERAENALPSLQVARKRADFVRRYLLAAGMREDVPVEMDESAPKQADTEAGRAHDRSVAIEVVASARRGGSE